MYLRMEIKVIILVDVFDINADVDTVLPGQNDEVIVGESIAIGHHLRTFIEN